MTEMSTFMHYAGFQGSSVGGSEFHFTRTTGEPRGSVVIHTHHGEGHFRKKQLDRLGTRLEKHFGWTCESFVAMNYEKIPARV